MLGYRADTEERDLMCTLEKIKSVGRLQRKVFVYNHTFFQCDSFSLR